MIFCPTCGNCLLIQKAAIDVRFYCKTCPYLFLIEQKISQKTNFQKKAVHDILGGKQAWQGVQQTEETCPKCDYNKAYFKQLQIRSADQPMTTFFKCAEGACGYQWREN